MTAILLLVFKDTILSLVASVQLTAQDMVRVGDWIEMPQFGADGDVIDVQLHTVKVQNWDKTITTIPTHRLDHGLVQELARHVANRCPANKARYCDRCVVDPYQTEDEVDHFTRFALLERTT